MGFHTLYISINLICNFLPSILVGVVVVVSAPEAAALRFGDSYIGV